MKILTCVLAYSLWISAGNSWAEEPGHLGALALNSDFLTNPSISDSFLLPNPGVLPLYPGDWGVTTVDAKGETGYNPSLALDEKGFPHIAYNDWKLGDLRYGRWDGRQWLIETVAQDGMVGGTPSITIDASGAVHISYYDYDKGDLWYARKGANGWIFELVDSSGYVGLWSSLKVDASGRVHIAYEDTTLPDDQGGMSLKYALRGPNGGWAVETVDNKGDVGQFANLVLDAQGQAHIAYLSYKGGGSISRARYSPAASLNANLTEIVVSINSGLYFPYSTSYGLKYARQNCTPGCVAWTWATEMVDTKGWSGYFPTLAVDSSGKAHIAHQDVKEHDLRYCVKSQGGAWSCSMVDSAGSVGEYSSMALNGQGNPQVVYYDVTGDEHSDNCSDPLLGPDEVCHYHRKMKFARYSGSSWSYETIWSSATHGNTYWHTSMAIDSKGIPHIAYTDGVEKDLRYARWSNTPSLSWTGEAGFSADGVDPQEGNSFVPFRFRVKYKDPDGDAPLADYPKLHVLRPAPAAFLVVPMDIPGSPFPMASYSGAGANLSFEKVLWLPAGNNYSYYFEAYDLWGVKAKGAPTSSKIGPLVQDVALPGEEDRIFAYPNPARGSQVTFHLTLDQLNPQIDLKIFDLSGALIRSVPSEQINKNAAPVYEYVWDMRDEQGAIVASGMYVYAIHAKDEQGGEKLKKVKRLAILK